MFSTSHNYKIARHGLTLLVYPITLFSLNSTDLMDLRLIFFIGFFVTCTFYYIFPYIFKDPKK